MTIQNAARNIRVAGADVYPNGVLSQERIKATGLQKYDVELDFISTGTAPVEALADNGTTIAIPQKSTVIVAYEGSAYNETTNTFQVFTGTFAAGRGAAGNAAAITLVAGHPAPTTSPAAGGAGATLTLGVNATDNRLFFSVAGVASQTITGTFRVRVASVTSLT